jgi:hypothetical protein
MVQPEKDPTKSWNPMNSFWQLFGPMVNPRPDASPVTLNPPAPIWDIPSPYGGVHHPEAKKDHIPFYVHPNYYLKLTMQPEHAVVHANPPFWMTVSNFGWTDVAKAPIAMLTAPGFMFLHQQLTRWLFL